jgi:hypothetical protein
VHPIYLRFLIVNLFLQDGDFTRDTASVNRFLGMESCDRMNPLVLFVMTPLNVMVTALLL